MKLPATVVFLLFFSRVIAQNPFAGYENLFSAVRNYVVYQTISEIEIDGKPDENSWQLAGWSEYFRDIEGDKKPQPRFKTRVKMLWDSRNLYILAELEETDVWAYYTNRDQIVFNENDFEIFIDPDRDTHNYFEFELNAQNTLFDLFMPKPYRNGGRFDIGWNAEGLESAVFVDGTINNPEDTDKKWMIEVAIPFASLKTEDDFVVPKQGSYWKINFSRVQWQTEVINGKYQRLKESATSKVLSEDNWVWSEQGVINMHFPERWGLILFSSKQAGTDRTDFIYPEDEIAGKHLWLIYYKQQDFRRKNGRFTDSITDLGMNETVLLENGTTGFIKMETNDSGFDAILKNNKGLIISINQEGLFKKLKIDSENE